MRVLVLGAPGSGKGTQAKLLADKLGVPSISVGSLLRDELKRKTKIGIEAGKYMETGDWVPFEISFQVLQKRLDLPDCKDGFVIDAFPKYLVEAHQLGAYLVERGWDINSVILLKLPDIVCFNRIQKRTALQKKQGKSRPDTEERIVLERIALHNKEIAPIINYYKDSKLLKEVDGTLPIGQIHKRVLKILEI